MSHRRAARNNFFEKLDQRALLAVTTDSNGWTIVSPAQDTQTIYVSTSGNDSNPGTQALPVKSLAVAKSLVHPNSADQLLLQRGDAWNESFGIWSLSGKSANEPILIGAYGSGARPIIHSGTKHGIDTDGLQVNNLAIIGLNFHSSGRDPSSSSFISPSPDSTGVRIVGGTTWFLMEDCAVNFYTDNVTIQDFNGLLMSNVKVRRNVITDAWSSTKGQGLYASGINNLLIEQNAFDHNGWNEQLGAGPTVYSHNVYLSARDTGVTVRGNIIANASGHGLQARSGGSITDNIFLKNPIGMSFGLVNGANGTPGGVTGEIARNVFLETRNTANNPRGIAIEIANIKAGTGANIHDNIFSQDGVNNFAAIQLNIGTNVTNANELTGINDLTIEKNIVRKWFSSMWTTTNLVDGASGPSGLNRLKVRNNDFQLINGTKEITHGHAYQSASETWSGNRYYDDSASSGWFSIGASTLSVDQWKAQVEPTLLNARVNYLDPDRTMATYNASLGGGASLNAFMTEARKQSSSNWRTQYTAGAGNDYVRAGFVETSPPSPPSPPPPPPSPPPPSPPPPPGQRGLSAIYYNNVDFTGTTLARIDPTINFNWNKSGPASSISGDTFSARWTGFITASFSQTYTIFAKNDEGVRVWIGNQLIIDHWSPHGSFEDKATIALQTGAKVPIQIEYFENSGKALMQLSWSSSSTTKQIIPASALSPV